MGLVLLEPRATAGNGLLKCGQSGGWGTLFPSPRMKFEHLCQMLRLVQAGDDDDNDDKRVAAPLTECDYGNDLLLSQKCHSSHHQRLAVQQCAGCLFWMEATYRIIMAGCCVGCRVGVGAQGDLALDTDGVLSVITDIHNVAADPLAKNPKH